MPSLSLIIVGGGLSGGLCALALAKGRPEVAVTLIEAGTAIGGNHLWSFFYSDVNERGRALVGVSAVALARTIAAGESAARTAWSSASLSMLL